jgi:hypothetical protein
VTTRARAPEAEGQKAWIALQKQKVAERRRSNHDARTLPEII